MIVILCVALVMLLWILGYYLHFLPVPKPAYYQYMTLVLIILVQPLVIYRTIKRNYESNNLLKETLEIEFTKKEIILKGESFYTELTWGKIYKVVELKGWFMIYQNSLSAILISRGSFKTKQIDEFKQILQSNSGLNLCLQKE